MEYIAKANCGVDSSFPTDRFRRVIEIFVFFFCLFKASRITVTYESVFLINSGRCSQVSEDFLNIQKNSLLQLARYI